MEMGVLTDSERQFTLAIMLLSSHGPAKGRIGVFIEDHFDMTEYRIFNRRFPAAGYELEYISNLWGNPTLQFGSNPDNGWVEEHITVAKDVADINPTNNGQKE